MEPEQLQELLLKAYQAAPPVVQNYVDEDSLDDFMLDLQVDMKLHADVADEVSNRILLTLFGVFSPEELQNALRHDIGLSDEDANTVISRMNEKIFVPLRDQMRGQRNQSEPTASPARPSAPLVPPPSLGVPQTAPTPVPIAPPAQPATTYAPDPTRPGVPTPDPTPIIVAAPSPTMPVPPPAAPAPAQHTEPTMRTMAHDVEAMKDGHAPAPMPYAMPNAPIQQPVQASSVPAVPSPSQPIPASEPPKPAEPGALPPRWSTPVSAPAPSAIPNIIKTPTPIPDPKEVTETLQKYGIDPYREPIE